MEDGGLHYHSTFTLMIEKYLKNNITNKSLENKMINGNLLNFE